MLWVPTMNLPLGVKVVEEWGFKYRSSLVWVKDKVGLGFWFRGAHEIVLVGIRGRPPRSKFMVDGVDTRSTMCIPPSVFFAPRTQHSEKPDEPYHIAEKWVSDGHRLDMFARKKRRGWDVWGNEVENDVELGE